LIHLVEARDVAKIIGGQKLLHEVNIDIKSGEIVGVLGPNGSGKTTLLSILATITAPSSGELLYFGEKIKNYTHLRSRIGYVSDSMAHYGDLTGFENALMFAGFYKINKNIARKRIEELFELFDLASDAGKRVKQYSFGMKRKLTLIESILHNPELLIFDEPTIGLDFISENKTHDLLRNRALDGTGIVVATNNIREAESICDRVMFMHKGRIVASETPKVLIGELGAARTINIELSKPIRLLPTVKEQKLSANSDGSMITAVTDRDSFAIVEIVQACVSAGGDILKVEVSDTDLGAVYSNIVGEAVRW
jgi:ABC-2 type transport system ATP-binding protein